MRRGRGGGCETQGACTRRNAAQTETPVQGAGNRRKCARADWPDARLIRGNPAQGSHVMHIVPSVHAKRGNRLSVDYNVSGQEGFGVCQEHDMSSSSELIWSIAWRK